MKRHLADLLLAVFGPAAKIHAADFNALRMLVCGGDSTASMVRVRLRGNVAFVCCACVAPLTARAYAKSRRSHYRALLSWQAEELSRLWPDLASGSAPVSVAAAAVSVPRLATPFCL